MKRLFPVVCLSCLIAAHSFAGSATWNLNPKNGDWNSAANWTPATVPSRSGDVATFEFSNLTQIQTSLRNTVDSIVFNPGASSYTITGARGTTINGSGIINDSGLPQNFFGISFTFRGSATAGTNTFLTGPLAGAGVISFYETSNAGEATISNRPAVNNNASTYFYNDSSAGHATVINSTNGANGQTVFDDQSTGAEATIINEGGTPSRLGAGRTLWYNESTAADATVISEGATGLGTYPGETGFFGGTPGNATLIARDGIDGGPGGSIIFVASPPINTARVELFGNGTLALYTATQIGSIEGDGIVTMGQFGLTVGNNSLSTTFSGTLDGDAGSSLTKVGTGTLILSGANTYTGGTTVLSGSLKVTNTTGSGTGSGAVSVQAGSIAGKGIISGAVSLGTGSGAGASLAPGKGSSTPTTLTLQSALTFKADSSYTYKLNTNKAKSDQVIANGLTIESGAQFDLTRVGNTQLTIGRIFTAISNTSATPIAGTFANLADGSTISAGVNKLQVSYSGGDGNDLTLTVVE